jgi:MFS family permease
MKNLSTMQQPGGSTMKAVRVYKYRWVVLLALMLVSIASQIQWLALAPISRAATAYYRNQIPTDSLVNPDLLTLIHLVMFVFFSIPASYLIDRFDLKLSLRSGALGIVVFSLVKGFGAERFWLVVVAQIGLAIAHPVILNSVTAVTARWFPLRERGFAAGLVSLGQYLGIFLVMILSPQLVSNNPRANDYGQGTANLLFWYGVVTAAVAFVSIFLFRERPSTPASIEPYQPVDFLQSFRLLMQKKHMRGFSLIFGFLWSMFNVFISKIDGITALIGVENSNGILGVVLLVGGMVGSVVIPALSDYFRKRKLFFFISICGVFLTFLVFAFSPDLIDLPRHSWVALINAGLLGFFFMSAIPLGFQYAAELSYPVPESSTQGVLLLNGHFFAVLVLLFMNIGGGAYLERVLITSVTLLFAAILGTLFLKESPIIVTEDERLREAIDKEIVHNQ